MSSLPAMRGGISIGQACGWATLAAGVALAAGLVLLGPPRTAAAQNSNHTGDTVVLQGGSGEVYIAGLPQGWSLGFQESTDIGHHLEWVPAGQEVKEWRDMIALQLFPKLIDLSPDEFLNRMADHYADSCEQVLATDIELTPSNGYPGALRVLACTRNKVTGLGEVTLFRAVMGDMAFYVAQRAWRMDPFAPQAIPVTGQQLDEGRRVIEFGLACHLGQAKRPCPPGWDPVLQTLDGDKPTVVFKAQ